MAVDTDIGFKPPATSQPHAPTALIPRSDVWKAIQYVYDWFAALVPSVGAAPKDAQYLVATANGTLTAERVTTDTATVAWDHGTAAQAKANVPDDAITFAKMQNIATDRLVGRDTASTGDPEALTVGGGVEFTGSGGIQTSAFTGDATKAAGGTALTLATVNGNVGSFGLAASVAQFTVNAKGLITAAVDVAIQIAIAAVTGLQAALDSKAAHATTLTAGAGMTGGGDLSANRTFDVIGGTSIIVGANDVQRAALTGDVTASQDSNATTIPNDTVTYAKMQNISAQFRMLGRNSASAGDTEEVTFSQFLDWVGSAANGDILYRAAGAWTRLPIGSDTNILTLASGLPSWAAASAGVSAASQAEMEAASSTTVAVTPGRQHFHPGHPKAWTAWNMSGTPAANASYGLSSFTDNAAGDNTVNHSITFSSASTCVVGSAERSIGGEGLIFGCVAHATTSSRMVGRTDSGAADDGNVASMAVWGDI